MTIFPRYVSSRFKDLKVGISSYSEDRTALEVIGNVGVGTTNPDVAVGTGNTAKLAVGIATANTMHAKQYFGDENNNFIASGAGSGQVGIDSGATLNILIGRGTGKCLTTGCRNVLMGLSSGCDMTTGFNNVGLGYNSLREVISGRSNVALGVKAGRNITVGDYNIFFGSNSGAGRTDSCNSIHIGVQAGRGQSGTTGGCKNISIGDNSFREAVVSTSASVRDHVGNISIGANTLSFAGIVTLPDEFSRNITIGHCAGVFYHTHTHGGSFSKLVDNVLIGSCSGRCGSGGRNVLLGSFVNSHYVGTAYSSTGGELNIGIGHSVCLPIQYGSRQLAIGHSDFQWIHGDSNYNVGIGITDPSNAVTSSDTQKLAVGILTAHNIFASRFQGDERRNFFAGEFAGTTSTFNNTSTCLNVAIGNSAGSNLNATGLNFPSSCFLHRVSQKNVLIGNCAGIAATTSCYNTIVGADAGISITSHSAFSNVLLGFCAGRCVTGSRNIAIGQIALDRLSSGSSGNIGIGFKAGRNGLDRITNNNISIGQLAGDAAITGCRNAFLGHYAGRNMATGEGGSMLCNIILGSEAGTRIENAHEIFENVLLGSRAGYTAKGLGITTAFSKNVLIGTCAGRFIAGSCNIYIGPEAAATLNNYCHCGVSNIGIGQSVQMPDRLGSNQLAIGQTSQYWITGDQSFNVGIGSTQPQGKLDVGGTIFANQLNVSGVSTFTGAIDANGNLDVDGQTDLDVLNVSDIATFSGLVDANNRLDVVGGANVDQLNVTGITTFGGNVSIAGTLSYEDVTNVDSIGIITAGHGLRVTKGGINVTAGVSTFGGNIDANGNLDVDGTTSLDDVLVTGFTTFFPTGGTKFLTTIEAENGMFVHNTGVSTFQTPVQIDAGATLNQLNVTGVSTFVGVVTTSDDLFVGGNLSLKDNKFLRLGNENDFNIRHSSAANSTFISQKDIAPGTQLIISSPSLTLQSASSPKYFMADTNTRLYHPLEGTAGKSVLETNGIGVTIYNQLDATDLNVSGIATVGIVTATNVFADQYRGDENNNFYVGFNAGSGAAGIASGATHNIGIGESSGANISTGCGNVLIGACSGCEITSGDHNIIIGCNGMRQLTTGRINIAIGIKPAPNQQTGQQNIYMGLFAGMGKTDGKLNVEIGDDAGRAMAVGNPGASGCQNTFLGAGAGSNQLYEFGDVNKFKGNTYLGAGAGRLNLYHNAPEVKRNIFIGMYAGHIFNACYVPSHNRPVDNVVIGSCAATFNSGAHNVFVGSYVNKRDNTGIGFTYSATCFSIGIGHSVCLAKHQGDRQLAIGHSDFQWIHGDCDYNVGIGTTIPSNAVTSGNTQKLAVGVATAHNVYSSQYFGDANHNFYAGPFVGSGAAGISSGACFNVGIGYSSLSHVTTGDKNVALGCQSGMLLTSASSNVLIGRCAGKCISTGNSNLALGLKAGRCLKTGFSNVNLGFQAGAFDGNSIENIAIGSNSGIAVNNAGFRNIAIGAFSGCLCSSTSCNSQRCFSQNIFFGEYTFFNYEACHALNHIITMGSYAGTLYHTDHNQCSSFNTIIGGAAAIKGSGCGNVFLGSYANSYNCGTFGIQNYCKSGGNHLIGIGHSVCVAKQFGNTQLAIGHASKQWIHGDSNYSVGIGITNPSIAKVGAGDTQTFAAGIVTAYQISAAFFSAGCNNGFGGNIAIGNSFTGNIISTDTGHSRAIAFGNNAGCQDTGHNNTFIGDQAGKNVVSGDDNIVLGGCALGKSVSNVCSSNNIIMGEDAAPVAESTNNNILMGNDVAGLFKFGCNNIGIGKKALQHNILGSNNVAIGCGAGRIASGPGVPGISTAGIGTNNIFLGCYATAPHSNPSNYLVIGNGEIFGSTFHEDTNWIIGDPNYNIGIGIGTPTSKLHVKGSAIITGVATAGIVTATSLFGRLKTDEHQNLYIGINAGSSKTLTACNIAIGHSAGNGLCGCDNVIFGTCAGNGFLLGGSTQTRNVLIGKQAGQCAVSTANNVYIGPSAGRFGTSAVSNIGIGFQAIRCVGNGSGNVALGSQAMRNATGGKNIALGGSAGCAVTGCYNLFFGCGAGSGITSGFYNILLGQQVQASSATADVELVIGCCTGRWVCGDSSFNVTLAGIATAKNDGTFLSKQLNVSGVSTVGTSVVDTLKVGTALTISKTNDSITTFNNNAPTIQHILEPSNNLETWASEVHTGGSAFFVPQFRIHNNGPVEAYYENGGKKFATSGIGATIFGQLDTTDLNVSGVSTFGTGISTFRNDVFFAGNPQTGFSVPSAMFWDKSDAALKFQGAGEISLGYDRADGRCLNIFQAVNSATDVIRAKNNSLLIQVGVNSELQLGSQSSGHYSFLSNPTIGVSTLPGSVDFTGGICVSGVATVGIVTATNIFADRYHGDQNNNFYAGPFTGSGTAGITSGATANIGIGLSLGSSISSGSCNIMLGSGCTGNKIRTGNDNILLGGCVGAALSTGNCNIAIGRRALQDVTNGSGNIAIGCRAGTHQAGGFYPDDPSFTISIGTKAGHNLLRNGKDNIFVGQAAGNNIMAGFSTTTEPNLGNILIGRDIGNGISASRFCGNIMMGYQVGFFGDNHPNDEAYKLNTIIGHKSGRLLKGNCNVFLGSYAGESTNGFTNIGLGHSIQMPDQFGSNQLAIGQTSQYWITGDQSFNVGIGSTTPQEKLDVGGTIISDNLNVTGIATFNEARFANNKRLKFGDDIDLQIYHLSATNNNFISAFNNSDLTISSGQIELMNQNHSAYFFKGEEAGSIVYHNNAERVATNGVGVTIYHQLDTTDLTAIGGNFTGIVTALDFVGGGINTSGTSQFNNVQLDALSVTGLSTFAGLVDINAGGQANTFKVEDLTAGRVVLAGTGGELEDSGNLTFNGSTLGVTGNASFSGDVSIGGTLTYEDVTNIDSVGLITARTGLKVLAGGADITGHTDLDNVSITGVTTFVSKNVHLGNSSSGSTGRLNFGDSNQLNIFYDSNTQDAKIVKTGGSGNLDIQTSSGSIDIITNTTFTAAKFASGGASLFKNQAVKFLTKLDGAAVVGILTANGLEVTSGVSTFNNNVGIASDKSLNIGNKLSTRYVSAINSVFQTNTAGQFISVSDSFTLQALNGKKLFKAGVSDDTGLYHQGTQKLGTNVNGISILNNASGSLGTMTALNVDTTFLNVSGVATFSSNINANGNIVGDDSTNISGINSVTATEYYGTGGTGSKLFVQDSQDNLLAGFRAGIAITTGENVAKQNVLLGCNVGRRMVCGCDNVIIGTNIFDKPHRGRRNVMLGHCVGAGFTTLAQVSTNVFIGRYTATSQQAAVSNSIAIGLCAAKCGTSTNSIVIGQLTGMGVQGQTHSNNIFLGTNAGTAISTGASNVAIGQNAGRCMCQGDANVFLGLNAGKCNFRGCFNVAIGCQALLGSNSGEMVAGRASNNIALGANAGFSVSSGDHNFLAGTSAGQSLISGNYNIAIGNLALACAITSGHNIALGLNAAANVTTGVHNLAFGLCSLFCTTSGGCNFAFGNRALNQMTAGCFNVAIGGCAGQFMTTGCRNVFLGDRAACAFVSGDFNIAIGNRVCVPLDTGSNQLAIGNRCCYYLTGDSSYNVGIGSTIPQARLDVFGGAKIDQLNVSGVSTFASSIHLADSIIHVDDTDTKIDFATNQIKFTAADRLRIDLNNNGINYLYGSNVSEATSTHPKPGTHPYVHRFRDTTGDNTEVQFFNTNVTNTILSWNAFGNTTAAGNLIFRDVNSGNLEYARFTGTGQFSIAKDFNVAGVSTFAGNIDANGNLDVAGVSTFAGDLSIADKIVHTGDTNTAIRFVSNDQVAVETSGDEALRVDNSGRLLIGTNSARTLFSGYVPHFQLEGTGAETHSQYSASIVANTDGVAGPAFYFAKSKGNTIGSNNAVVANDTLGTIVFNGADGTDIQTIGAIFRAKADSNATSNRVDGRLEFLTSSNGSSPTERLRISSDGNVTVNHDLSVSGISTFTDDINANGNIVGDDSTNISGINTVGANFYFGCGGVGSRLFQQDSARNMIAGTNAGLAITLTTSPQPQSNILIGQCAGSRISTSCLTVAIGQNAGACITGGSGQNTLVGSNAGQRMGCCGGSGNGNVFFGFGAGKCGFNPTANTFIGYEAGLGHPDSISGSGGACNIAIGYRAANNIRSGNNNVFMGRFTGSSNSTGTNNFASGNFAFACNLSGGSNITIGGESLGKNISGAHNVSFGCRTLFCNTTSSFNVAIGHQALKSNTFANNIAIGCKAGCESLCGPNIMIGEGSGMFLNGCHNTLLGTSAGNKSTEATGNTFIGRASGGCNTTGSKNVSVGWNAGIGYTTGSGNINIGRESGPQSCGATGSANISMGQFAGLSISSGQCNISMGECAGCEITSGGCNIVLGTGAGKKLHSSSDNIAIGRFTAAFNNVTGNYNIMFGTRAGSRITSGSQNVFMGSSAGRHVTSGARNFAVGSQSSYCLSGGNDNVGIGACSNRCLASGLDNIAIGRCSGYLNTTTHGNVSIGHSAGYGIAGDNNVSIGSSAGSSASATGDDNIYVGKFSGANITTGHTNVFLGPYAGRATASSSANNNIGIGMNVGKCLTTGFNNIFFGKNAGLANTGGKANIFMGLFSGTANAGGSNNHFIGGLSGMQNTTGKQNNFIGFYAGAGNTSGDYNIFFGTAAALNNTTGSCTVAIGHHAARCQTTANATIAIGHCAGAGNTITGADNIMVGRSAGFAVTTAFNNIFMGTCAGANTGIGTENIFIGTCAGLCNTDGARSVFIGYEAGRFVTTGVVNVAIGHRAGCCIKTGNTNVAVGSNAGSKVCSGSGNVMLGTEAAVNMTTGGCNAIIGRNAGKSLSSGNDNNVFGHFAGCKLASGSSNVLMGNCAGYCLTGHNNVMLGKSSGFNRSGNKYCRNVLVGQSAGSSAGTLAIGNMDVLIGFNAGCNYTGSCSIGIGHSVCLPIADGQNQLAIGQYEDRWIVGTCDFNVGIGITTPTSKLHVGGDAVVSGVVTATDFDATSDIRLKTNIQPIDDPIAKVIQIEGVSFNWKKDNQPALGVIADQVEKILPQLVHGGDPKTVNYNGLVGLLIEVVKDQQKQINTLSERISKLE